VAVLNRTLARTRPKAMASSHWRQVLLVALAAVVVIALLEVVQTSQATTHSFAIQRLEQQKLELTTGVQQLEAEVASLSSLSRIEGEAQRLGLEAAQTRESVEVNVAWTAADEGRLPTRFAPGEQEEAEVDRQGSSWWRDLLKPLSFY
jgi:cell division protein FtsL